MGFAEYEVDSGQQHENKHQKYFDHPRSDFLLRVWPVKQPEIRSHDKRGFFPAVKIRARMARIPMENRHGADSHPPRS